jgi:hypothetical protein
VRLCAVFVLDVHPCLVELEPDALLWLLTAAEAGLVICTALCAQTSSLLPSCEDVLNACRRDLPLFWLVLGVAVWGVRVLKGQHTTVSTGDAHGDVGCRLRCSSCPIRCAVDTRATFLRQESHETHLIPRVCALCWTLLQTVSTQLPTLFSYLVTYSSVTHKRSMTSCTLPTFACMPSAACVSV